jgi:anthranilate phosphoribosyltransferase
MIRDSIVKLSKKQALSEQEAHEAVLEMLEGKATPAQIGAYLSMLAYKGETQDEVIGSVKAMREKMVRLENVDPSAIDVCGTGGDHQGTFNISTTAAFVLAGGGVTVAKHGNRAASSQCGSAEVLDSLGVKLDATFRVLEKCLKEAGIAFLFAPQFHPAMKNVAPIRKELGIRTLFNILGPMCNPASVKRQVIGVFDADKAKLMAESLIRSGSERIVTLHSQEGLDEVSCAGPTTLFECVAGGSVKVQEISPETFGLPRHPLASLKGSDAAANAGIVTEVLKGTKGPRRDAVVMNAAVGLYLAGKASDLKKAREQAEASIDSGKALLALENLKKISHQ